MVFNWNTFIGKHLQAYKKVSDLDPLEVAHHGRYTEKRFRQLQAKQLLQSAIFVKLQYLKQFFKKYYL